MRGSGPAALLGPVRLGYPCLCLTLCDVQYTRGTILKYAQPERRGRVRDLEAAGRPAQDPLLEPGPGQRPGAHAQLVDPDELVDFLAQAPPRPFDFMLEAKEKERALLLLRQQLAERPPLRAVA